MSFTSHLKYHKQHIKQIIVHITSHTRIKTLIEIILFSPFVVKTSKREKSYEVKPATRHPLSPHHHQPAPHRCRPKKHEQGQCRKQPTRQESASRRGRGRAGRQGRQRTPRAAHPAGCE
jgi:hypothetical protein